MTQTPGYRRSHARRHDVATPSRMTRWSMLAAMVGGVLLSASGCEGVQSTLAPAGESAEWIATLWWWLFGGGVAIWTIMVLLLTYASFARRGPHDAWTVKLWVIGGGAVFPTIVLTATLIGGLWMLPDLLAPPPEGSLRIDVVGEQYWWRVRYPDPPYVSSPEFEPSTDRAREETGSLPFTELANEIRLPVGEPVEFRLESADVIHAFWIPPLGGKMDMIPGRRNRLTLLPTKTGIYRGQCAEYCGESHAWMALDVVVVEKEEFERWLAEQRKAASPPTEPLAARGQEIFLSRGCGACHAIRGTPADGVVGPDLTHVGTRLRIGASRLDAELESFHLWIAQPDAVKPGVHMPAFHMLPDDELAALSAYLEGLR
ncbi:MAG TPA: cytochrome c oxidase subunit II [Pirellulaceae bacterium]|nr:cytochrome c oxidase subunit II [Pirellulaceae bacterium]